MRDSGLLDFKVLSKSIKTTEVIYFIKVIVTELKKGNETLTKKVSELENIIKERETK